jgi:hypothetical protein
MHLLWKRRARAVRQYCRESVTAIPRIRAAGRIQAWRFGDGEVARPVYTVPPPARSPRSPTVFRLAA